MENSHIKKNETKSVLSFDDFPETPDPFWRDVTYEAQRRSFQTILPHPPPIIFKEKELLPINDWVEDYLGTYFMGDDNNTGYLLGEKTGRRIEIYPNRIKQCADQLGLTQSDLTMVVVVHELMHALLHTGCSIHNPDGKSESNEADVYEYLMKRCQFFEPLSSEVKELHAQLGTWHLLSNGGRNTPPQRGVSESVHNPYVTATG